MSNATLHDRYGDNNSEPALRPDLDGVFVGRGNRRAWMVIDDIGGRFARIPEHLWRTLRNRTADDDLWAQADAAGWTRRRSTQSATVPGTRNPFKRPQSLLAIRVPLFQFDAVANHLLGLTGWVFSGKATRVFLATMMMAAVFVMTQYHEVAKTLSELPSLFSGANAWSVGAVFLLTKLLHELGHAIACRRVGARCGEIGVIFFFGIPCPYCDVTQVWRIPDWRSRAGVMMAGMYVEGILATAATLVWAISDEGPMQLHAMNVMIVCSVSTLVFNANPLMRYDGYYVLADWAGSVNLRTEARLAFRDVWNRPSLIRQRRRAGLSVFYIASTVYRCVVLIVIASVILAYAESAGLKLIATATLIASLVMMVGKAMTRSVLRSRSAVAAKIFGFSLSALLLGMLLCVPLPKRITVTGYIDAQDVTEVFLGADGVIQDVSFDFGQQVRRGEFLGSVRADELDVQSVRVNGQLNVASLRSRSMRRRALEDSESSSQLESLEAVEHSLQASLVSLERQRSRLAVTATTAGMIVPSLDASTGQRRRSHAGKSSAWDSTPRLSDRVGMRSVRGTPWCRIASSQRIAAVFCVDARYRECLAVDDVIIGYQEQSPSDVKRYRIVSISSIRTASSDEVGRHDPVRIGRQGIKEEPAVEVFCESLDDSDDDADLFLPKLGGTCHGVIKLPSRSLGEDVLQYIKELFS